MGRNGLTPYQAKYYAAELQRSYANDHVGKLAGLLFDAQVEPKPHQIDAALFALQTPFLPGVILADEVGLGKTIEAGIVISQFWAERKRRILIIVPSSLRQQWKQELFEKFLLPSEIVDGKSKERLLSGSKQAEILICSYEFAARHSDSILRPWNLVVVDEAHRLRSFWNGRAKIATAVSAILKGASKTVLLTATPLQNKLEELYGLVSVFDPTYFYSLDAFRERYIKNRDVSGDDLVDRVAAISKRTLRRDADKYIQFTERLPLTLKFEPSPDERRLYDLVNDYLQRDELYAFAQSQRHLSALILRKRLGSSTYAVASTLENIANRLADEIASGGQRDRRGGLFFEEDLTSDEVEEFEEETPVFDDEAELSGVVEAMLAEVDEFRLYARLARSITENQKAIALVQALSQGFERLRDLGAPEKAIIFTDSTKTQEYIAKHLEDNGWGDGLVLFNGSNNSPAANAIYHEWLEKHRDGDLITGVSTVDRRKALVDYFRDQGKIMIATEAAAEGINLQFCSMLVNYDLPWNPQRVEQRIGRVHRFGQKHNVLVVNFSNEGNLAEKRILELLEDKFHLFDSVFGASDEVLGAIEDGIDFDKRISRILDQCKTAEEIDVAFQELSDEYENEISSEMDSVKTKVFDNLDPHVQDRLKSYDDQSEQVLNKFERLLLATTQFELRDRAEFEGDGRHFRLLESPTSDAPVGRYYFKSEPEDHARQYRYSGPLAQWVVQQAADEDTPSRLLTFSLGKSRPSASARELAGQSGELTVDLVTFTMKAGTEDVSESYLLAAGATDNGKELDDEHVADILDLYCVEHGDELLLDPTKFRRQLEEQKSQLEREVQVRNAMYYNQQEEILDRNIQDRRAELDAKVREYRGKAKEERRLAKQADDPMEALKHKKEARKWDDRAEDADDDFRDERRQLRQKRDHMLEMIEQSLRGTQDTSHLFSIRWSIEE